MDPSFNEDPERAKTICRWLLDLEPRRTTFRAELRAERVDAELASLMSRLGFEHLEVGLQSASARELAAVGRGHHEGRFQEGVRLLHEHTLRFELQLIFGLPEQTWESYLDSIRAVLALQPPQVSLFPLHVLPGTDLWERGGDLGIEFTRFPPHFVTRHPRLGQDDLLRGRYLGRVVQLLYNLCPKSTAVLCRELRLGLLDLALGVAEALLRTAGPEADLRQQLLLRTETLQEHVLEHVAEASASTRASTEWRFRRSADAPPVRRSRRHDAHARGRSVAWG